MLYDVIIIGAGASGLFAAASFQNSKVNGLILEKTGKAGTKLLMSGTGQCNLTHDDSIKDFVSHYGKKGAAIRSILYRYSNLAVMNCFEAWGIPLTTREDGKVFPASRNARDILNVLLSQTAQSGFSIEYNASVSAVSQVNSPSGILYEIAATGGATYRSKAVIVASGGCSYPTSGSDGSMFSVLRNMDIAIVPPKPALSPIFVQNYPYGELSGISFTDIRASLFRSVPKIAGGPARTISPKIAETVGDLLFTHSNFSGPAMLCLSRYAQPGDTLILDYSTATNPLPKRFLRLLSAACKSEKEVAARLTRDAFSVSGTAGFLEAMVTAGGVALSEMNLKTMESKKYPRLYIVGECLDVDGDTGGYNLQFAFSSAYAAVYSMTLL